MINAQGGHPQGVRLLVLYASGCHAGLLIVVRDVLIISFFSYLCIGGFIFFVLPAAFSSFYNMTSRRLIYVCLALIFHFSVLLAASGGQGASGTPDELKEAKAYLRKSDYNSALSRLLQYIQKEEHSKNFDTLNLMNAYYDVGGVYSVYSNFAQALDVYEKGYRLSTQSGNAGMQFKFLNNMIGAGCNIGNVEYASRLNEKVKALKGVPRGRLLFYYYFNKGFIAGIRDEMGEKTRWMNEAVAVVDKYGLPGEMKIYPYSEVYQCYEKQGDLTKALEVLQKYDSLAQLKNEAYLYADCYKGMMRVYTKLGNKEKALFYQNEFFRYTDSLLNVNEFSQIKNRYQIHEKKLDRQTIDNQKRTIFYQNAALVLLLLVVAVACTAVVMVWRQRRKLHVAYVALFERNRELLEIESRYRDIVDRQKARIDETDNVDERQDKSVAPVPNSEELLQRIDAVMEDEDAFCSPDFSLAVLARLSESNTNYVSQVINSTYNKNFRTFLNERRIKVAMKRMMDTGRYGAYSMQGIAESVGYKSASNFIAAFKKVTGMTPSLYQKMLRN